jgi:quercetin dioxygenase-like cupin family protein
MRLHDLAQYSGLSIGYLSKIERGQCAPTLSALTKLGGVFGNTIEAFLQQGPGTPSALVNRKGKTHKLQVENGQIAVELLTDILKGNPRIQMVLATLQPGAGFREDHSHNGEETLYLLSGKIEVKVAGDLFILKAGDSIWYEATKTHNLRNLGKGPARYLICITPPNLRGT